MDLSGTQHFNKSPQDVWNALQSAGTLKGAFSGLQGITWSGNTIQVQAQVSLGPINRDLNATLDIVEQSAPNHLKVAAERGSGSGTVTIDLADDGSGGTNMTYSANLTLAGPLGAMDGIAKPLVDGALKSGLGNLAGSL